MIIVGILFLMLWLGIGIEMRRINKKRDRDYHIYFGRDYK